VELWIPITVAAAFMQNLRTALQRHLKGALSTGGATSARFLYAVPLACLYVIGLARILDAPLPVPNGEFLFHGAAGGIAQILATALLVSLFSFRNFAVGNAYAKTETVQSAIFGVVILGETVSPSASVAIGVSVLGVFAITFARSREELSTVLGSLANRPALMGLAAGALFGVSAVEYRAAALALGGDGFLMQAAFTLACVTAWQSLLMVIYLAMREPGQLGRVFRSWRITGLVGLFGMLGSACWFTAMTIQNVAYVRALGQIELVFTFIASYVFFHERTNRTEFIGILLIVAGILILLVGRA
jgi:drug/metabolite transporter (DMT)-like permease